MICPNCGYDNVPGSEHCQDCMQDLTQLDQPVAHDRVERSLLEETVRVLKPRSPVTLPPDVTVAEAIRTMLLHDVGALLIVDDHGKLQGIFSERDLLTKVAGLEADYAGRPVREFMTSNPETVSTDATLAFVLHKMDGGGYRHVPVLRDGRPTGMISVRDMLRHITKVCKHV